MFQRDVKYHPNFRRANRDRHHDFPIADRKCSRLVVPEIQEEPSLSEYERLRHQENFRPRIRRSTEVEEAQPVVQLHHVDERSVVRRSDVSTAIGSVVQSHRVDRAHDL